MTAWRIVRQCFDIHKSTKWWIEVITLPCDPHLKFTKEHFRFSLSFFFLFAEIKKQPKENLFINVKNLTSSNEPRFSGISQRIRYVFFTRNQKKKKIRFSYINNRSDSPDVWRYSFSWAVFILPSVSFPKEFFSYAGRQRMLGYRSTAPLYVSSQVAFTNHTSWVSSKRFRFVRFRLNRQAICFKPRLTKRNFQ